MQRFSTLSSPVSSPLREMPSSQLRIIITNKHLRIYLAKTYVSLHLTHYIFSTRHIIYSPLDTLYTLHSTHYILSTYDYI